MKRAAKAPSVRAAQRPKAAPVLSAEEREIAERGEAFANMRASKAFPGRASLSIQEFARYFSCSPAHVVGLILNGSLKGKEIEGSTAKRTSRAHWRITVEAYDDFIKERIGRAAAKERARQRQGGCAQ